MCKRSGMQKTKFLQVTYVIFFAFFRPFKASKGLFVTTSTFSPTAKETADLLSNVSSSLMDIC